MQKESKIAVLGFGLGFVLFVLCEKLIFSKKGVSATAPSIPDKDIEAAADAYSHALDNNEPDTVLSSLNEGFATRYNLKVRMGSSDNSLIITDLAGNQIATYQR